VAEEQVLVLRMLEEGKITAEQAVELLEALKRPERKQREPRSVEAIVREETRKAGQAARAEAARARAMAEKARAQARRQIERRRPERTVVATLRALGIPWSGGREFTYSRSLSGEFGEGQAEIQLQITNGRIQICPSSSEQWQLTLTSRVRADDEVTAEKLAEKLVQVDSDSNRLLVEAQRLFGQNAKVDIDLRLPRRRLGAVIASTTNGSIKAQELKADTVIFKTVNGRVTGEKLEIDSLQASTVNGRVHIAGAIKEMRGRATNGRILVQVAPGDTELDLGTVNGSVNVTLATDERIGYQLDLTSVFGSIRQELPDIVVKEEEKRPGRRVFRAESAAWADKDIRQSVRARTVSGPVRINLPEEEGN